MSNKDNGLVGKPGAVNVGYGNYVVSKRIVAILETGSLPMKRLRDRSVQANLLVDATAGRKTRSLIITDSQHVVLSALAPHTLHDRLLQCGSIQASLAELEGGELVS